MKAVVKSITAFVVLNVVAASPIYYMYDEKPDAGNGATIGSSGAYKNRLNNHKKYFIGSNNPKYMKLVNERAVDSHFTVEKTPSKPYVISENGKIIEITEVARNSQNYRRKVKEDISSSNGEHHVSASTKNDVEGSQQEKHKTTVPDNQQYSAIQNLYRYSQREYLLNAENLHDKKHNFVSVNAHKATVSKDDRVVVKKGNQQFMHQPQMYQRTIAGVEVKDKSLHKTAAANERNTQLALAKNLDLGNTQMAALNTNGLNQKPVSNSQRMDSKKRDTVNIKPSTPDNFRSTPASDKIIKYIHKDVTNYTERKTAIVPSRIGNHEEIVDVNETPYALFYRTNPEHLDDQEVLIENPLAEPTNSAYSGKMAWSIENEAQEDPIKTKSKREPNVKIHKKVKNHTSYRNS